MQSSRANLWINLLYVQSEKLWNGTLRRSLLNCLCAHPQWPYIFSRLQIVTDWFFVFVCAMIMSIYVYIKKWQQDVEKCQGVPAAIALVQYWYIIFFSRANFRGFVEATHRSPALKLKRNFLDRGHGSRIIGAPAALSDQTVCSLPILIFHFQSVTICHGFISLCL